MMQFEDILCNVLRFKCSGNPVAAVLILYQESEHGTWHHSAMVLFLLSPRLPVSCRSSWSALVPLGMDHAVMLSIHNIYYILED